MNRNTLFSLLAILNLAYGAATAAPLGTAFTYQGRLNDNAQAANGLYDLKFVLFDVPEYGFPVGRIFTNTALAVSGGLFTAELDFSTNVFTGEARWLEIGVRTNGGGGFITLVPRQPLTPIPYALYAPDAGTASASSNLLGTLPDAQLSTNVARFDSDAIFAHNVTAPRFFGAFSGNGAALTSVNATTLGGQGSDSFWQLGGNQKTTPGTDFLGTADNRAMEIKVNNQRALRLEPATNGGPNVIGGSSKNFVSAGVSGATIGGGGGQFLTGGLTLNWTNRVNNDFGTVGGGADNRSSGEFGTVGGGLANTSSGDTTTVGGGYNNTSSGVSATVPGGRENTAGGMYSFAAGYRAKASHVGAFVWGDSYSADVTSTNTDSWTVRARGGVRFFANSSATVGVRLAAGGNAWDQMSDRNVKENFKAVDPRSVLEKVSRLPVTEWNLISQPASIRHIGPMAQDFQAAFGVGEDDKHISTTDADGVALAAIQGLNQVVKDKEARIERLEKEVAELKAMVNSLLEELTSRVTNLAPDNPLLPAGPTKPFLTIRKRQPFCRA